MQLTLGPLLYSRGGTPTEWCFIVAVLIDDSSTENAPLTLHIDSAVGVSVGSPVVLADFQDVRRGVYWGWPVSVARGGTPTILSYRLSAASHPVAGIVPGRTFGPVRIPALNELPRFAFFSCNGFSDPQQMRHESDPFRLWRDLADHHRRSRRVHPSHAEPGLHLLVGGGDQVYADELWAIGHPLAAYGELTANEMTRVRLSQEEEKAVLGAYVDLYCRRFSAQPFGEVASQVPGIFTWDDHDIFDGWGSYPPRLQGCRLFSQVFGAARRAFEAFQLGGNGSTLRVGHRDHYLQIGAFEATSGRLDLVLLDTRTQRTLDQVMSPRQHQDLFEWLEEEAVRPGTASRRHCVVVSTIPLAYMRFSEALEGATDSLRPFSRLRMDDDMRDQWESQGHAGEKSALVSRLFGHAAASRARVTVLSGDVHLGSRGRFVSTDPRHVLPGEPDAVIEQLTSSGIVHPPPSRMEFVGMLRLAAISDFWVGRYVRSSILGLGDEGFVRGRNWLSVAFDEDPSKARCRLWAQWRTEAASLTHQVVVETPDSAQGSR